MINMKQQLLITIIPIIILSGCIGTTSNKGVVIESFGTDFKEAYSGEDVEFHLKLINQGESPAYLTEVALMGLAEGSERWTYISNTCTGLAGKALQPGTSFNCVWKLSAPELPKGLTMQYNPFARVSYTYTTSTIKSITFGSISELRRVEKIGNLPSTTATTGGPISIEIQARDPVRISGWAVTFPIKINVNNVGDGMVCRGTCEGGNTNSLVLEIITDMTIEDCANYEEINLYKGKSNSITCAIRYSAREEGPLQKIIEVRSNYGYSVEKETSITVSRRGAEVG
jgi:hypothetical protein